MSEQITENTVEDYSMQAFRKATNPSSRKWEQSFGNVTTRLEALEKEYEAKKLLLTQEGSNILETIYSECVSGRNKEFRAAFYKEYSSRPMQPAFVRRASAEWGETENYYDILEFNGKTFQFRKSAYIGPECISFPE